MRVFIFPLILLIAACSSESENSDQVSKPKPVKIFQVGNANQSLVREFPAQIFPADPSQLAFRVSGVIESIPVTSGSYVKKNELLAALDKKDYQIQLQDRKARYDLSQVNYQRVLQMRNNNTASLAQLDQAKAELDISRSALEAARNELQYTEIRAPYTGQIASIMSEPFQSVQAGQPVLAIQSANKVEVHFEVSETLLVRLKDNKKYQPTVVIDALPEVELKAQYLEHDSQTSPTTGGYNFVLIMDRPDSINILPGMSARVIANLAEVSKDFQEVFVIPPESVFAEYDDNNDKTSFVWVIDNKDMTLKKRAVIIGEIKENGVEVISGLSNEEQILAAGVHRAIEGMKVRPWKQERGI